MSKVFSHGNNAEVMLMDESRSDYIFFPEAEIVREERPRYGISAEVAAKQFFYSNRIARILYPDHFIHVVGARYENGTAFQYSKLAPVPADHATYCMHYSEQSACNCEICSNHRKFHEENSLANRANQLYETVDQSGILVPSHDPTDYCLTDTGDILFFEVGIEARKCFNSVQKSKIDIDERKRILELLKRYMIFDNLRDDQSSQGMA